MVGHTPASSQPEEQPTKRTRVESQEGGGVTETTTTTTTTETPPPTTPTKVTSTLPVVDPAFDAEHPYNLIPEICRVFYSNGWVTGTGGGMSMRIDDQIFIAPSGVQKERMTPWDIFILDAKDATKIIAPPRNGKPHKISECTPLFMSAYAKRNAGAVLHSHSPNCALVSMLHKEEFRISHIEMIKGIKNNQTKKSLGFRDTLVVPIIDNTDFECDLTASLQRAMDAYPETCAVIVRRHGVYVWGDTWQQAKGMVECYDYLFQVALQMKTLGLELTPASQ